MNLIVLLCSPHNFAKTVRAAAFISFIPASQYSKIVKGSVILKYVSQT